MLKQKLAYIHYNPVLAGLCNYGKNINIQLPEFMKKE